MMSPSDHPVAGERATPATAWLFDVDGVLTEPEHKTVREPALFDELIRRLARGEPVGTNTGRSLTFLEAEVLDPLEARVPDRRLLHGLIAIGERGSAWATYDADGTRTEHIDARTPFSPALADEVRALVQRPDFARVMFFDETKRTMISTELWPGKTIAEFAEPQRALVAELHAMLARHGLADQFRVDPTSIATDIEYRGAGKGFGAIGFAEKLEARGIRPARYVCFGDSRSDYDMLEALLARGDRAELVFVGEPDQLAGRDMRFVTFIEPLYAPGTLAYLRAH
jgi:hydroxymethylpyrimidine pyrophosphatase-like HAD family hydrolase